MASRRAGRLKLIARIWSFSTSCSPNAMGWTYAGGSGPKGTSQLSCSRLGAKSPTASPGSNWVPTTTSSSRFRRGSWWSGSSRSCGVSRRRRSGRSDTSRPVVCLSTLTGARSCWGPGRRPHRYRVRSVVVPGQASPCCVFAGAVVGAGLGATRRRSTPVRPPSQSTSAACERRSRTIPRIRGASARVGLWLPVHTVIGEALIIGGATLVVGVVLAVLLRRLPSVRLQLTGLAMLAVALPLASVTLSGLLVFHMGAQAEVLFVSAAAAATSLVGAILLTRNIVLHLERVRDASHELASGDLAARAPEGGPAELAELATSFNAMAGHLEEVFDARRELVAWASHDLRAPITSLQAMLEAMEDGVVEPQHYLETLQGQVRLLSTLVDDLFEMACIDSGAITLAVGPVDLGALVKGFLQHYELEAQAPVCGSEQSCVTRRPGRFAPRTKSSGC